MASVQIKFKPEYDDFLTVGKATTFNKTTIVLLVLMGVFAVITLAGIFLGWVAFDPNNLGLYLVPHGVYVFFLLYTPFHLRQTARQSAKGSHEIAWQVTQRGITVSRDGESNRHLWKAFTLIQELPGHYVLYFKSSRVKYIFIPKRAFTSNVQETSFREMTQASIGKIK